MVFFIKLINSLNNCHGVDVKMEFNLNKKK